MKKIARTNTARLRAWLIRILCTTLLVPLPSQALPTQGHDFMYSGPSPWAIEIGREIRDQGGNAVDIAVAVALSLAVTHPYFASLGGGGFAMVKMNGKVQALDFRETAPGATSSETFKNRESNASRDGGLAAGIPGVPAGLEELHRKHGKLKWSNLFAGAVRLAEKGFLVSGEWADLTSRNKYRFNSAGQNILFYRKSSNRTLIDLRPGDRLKQPELAQLLKLLQKKGASAFYEGPVAEDQISTVATAGGVFSAKDFRTYKTRWLEPLSTEFAGHKLYLMPPPSSGGVIIASALRLAEKLGLRQTQPLSVEELHLLIETMKLSFSNRHRLGDPAFSKNVVPQLLDDQYLTQLAARVRHGRAMPVEDIPAPKFDHDNTTHFSVVTANGDAVSMTITLNGDYGCGLVTPKFGIALNNIMDDFTTQLGKPNMFGLIQGEANLVRPGARALSSMSPTIVEKDGQTVLAVGAPGGGRIPTAVLQVLYRFIAQGFDVEQAILAPRLHHQYLPNKVFVDALKLPPETLRALENRGHEIETGRTGRVYAVSRSREAILSGAGDPRSESASGGQ